MAAPLLRRFTDLLAAGKIDQQEHDALAKLARDITTNSAVDGELFVHIPGNVLVSASLSRGKLEAVSKVFNTAELLQAILLQLPLFDLLWRAKCICKSFRDAIENSMDIQRKLFRLPDPNATPQLFPLSLEGLDKLYDLNEDSYNANYKGFKGL